MPDVVCKTKGCSQEGKTFFLSKTTSIQQKEGGFVMADRCPDCNTPLEMIPRDKDENIPLPNIPNSVGKRGYKHRKGGKTIY